MFRGQGYIQAEGGSWGREGVTESIGCSIILQTKHVVGNGVHDEEFVHSFMAVDSGGEDVVLGSTRPVVKWWGCSWCRVTLLPLLSFLFGEKSSIERRREG